MVTHLHSQASVAMLLFPALAATAQAQSTEERHRRGDAVIRELNNGASQPVLERMRQESPFLADATQGYALGEVWSRPGLDRRTHQLAAVAAFAAMGEPEFLKIHAGYALNLRTSEEELKEIVHLTTVTAGFLKAIAALQALSVLFAERRVSPN